MVDYLIGSALLIAGVWLLFAASRRLGFPGWPVATFGFILTPIGSTLYLPSSPMSIANDGVSYLEWGSSIAERWAGGDTQTYTDPIWPGKGVWPAVIAVANLALGPVAFVPLVISVLSLLAAFTVIQKSATLLSSDSRVSTIVPLVLTSPSIVLFGLSLLRESFFWLGVSLIVLSLSQLVHSSIGESCFSLCAGIFVTLAFRPDVGIVLVYLSMVLLIAMVTFTRHLSLWKRLGLFFTFTVPFATSFPAVFAFMQPTASVTKVEAINRGLSKEGISSAFTRPEVTSPFLETGCDSSTYLKLICEAVLNSPRSYFGPFLWESELTLGIAIATVSTFHIGALFILSFLGMQSTQGLSKLVIASSIALALASTIVWASTLTNYGILVRFRGTTEMILLPAAAVGTTKALRWLRKCRCRFFGFAEGLSALKLK